MEDYKYEVLRHQDVQLIYSVASFKLVITGEDKRWEEEGKQHFGTLMEALEVIVNNESKS